MEYEDTDSIYTARIYKGTCYATTMYNSVNIRLRRSDDKHDTHNLTRHDVRNDEYVGRIATKFREL